MAENSPEAALELDQLDPEAALRRMVKSTFGHHDSNVDFTDPETRARHKEMICEAVLRYVRA